MFIRRMSHARWRLKKIHSSTWVVGMCGVTIAFRCFIVTIIMGQLMHAAYIFAIWYGRSILMLTWQLSKQGIRWPVSHDHIAGSSVGHLFFFFLIHRWPGYGFSLNRRLKHFHKVLKQAKTSKLRFEARLNLYITSSSRNMSGFFHALCV